MALCTFRQHDYISGGDDMVLRLQWLTWIDGEKAYMRAKEENDIVDGSLRLG